MISKKNKYSFIIIGLLGIAFICFYAWLLPHFDVSDLKNNIYSLDIRSSYNKEIVNQLFSTIGEKGIIQYRKFLFIDFVYILIYGSLSFFLIQFLLNNMGRLSNWLKFTIWTPGILMLIDCIENINTFFMLKNANNLSESAVQFGSVLSSSKWIVASIVVGMIICYSFYAILRFLFWKFKNYDSNTTK